MGSTTAGGRVEAWNQVRSIQTQTSMKGENSLVVVDNLYRLLQAKAELSAAIGDKLTNGFPADVLMQISGITKSFGYHINKDGKKVYSTGIFTNLDSDVSDAGVKAGESISNVNLKLNPLSPYYPKIDIMSSKSSNVKEGFITPEHYRLRTQCIKLLDKREQMRLGKLAVDQNVIDIADRIYAYFSQRIIGATKSYSCG